MLRAPPTESKLFVCVLVGLSRDFVFVRLVYFVALLNRGEWQCSDSRCGARCGIGDVAVSRPNADRRVKARRYKQVGSDGECSDRASVTGQHSNLFAFGQIPNSYLVIAPA